MVGNPQWIGAPQIEIETFDSVVVDWTDVIYNAQGGQGRDCTDNFRVKWWLTRHPSNYSLSELLPSTDRKFIVTGLMQSETYAFQVHFALNLNKKYDYRILRKNLEKCFRIIFEQ